MESDSVTKRASFLDGTNERGMGSWLTSAEDDSIKKSCPCLEKFMGFGPSPFSALGGMKCSQMGVVAITAGPGASL